MNQLLRLLWVVVLRRATRLAVLDTCRTPFTVVPGDLDVLRHMNNGIYLSLMDLGRVDYMRRTGLWAGLTRKRWYPVITLCSMRYRRSLTLFQRFAIETRFLGHDATTLFVEQRFVRRGELVAVGVVGARFLKASGGTVTPEELLVLGGFTGTAPTLPDWVTQWSEAARA